MKEIKKPEKKTCNNHNDCTEVSIWNRCYDLCMAWHKTDKIETLGELKVKNNQWNNNDTYNLINAFNQHLQEAIEREKK